MQPILSKDLTDALDASESSELEVIDPATNRVYFIVDVELHQRARAALRQQELDWAAIEAGIAQADRGQTTSFEDADRKIREDFGMTARP